MSEKIGKYEILERIGGSGATSVLRARDPRLNRPVAIRVISPQGGITDELRTRFFTEAQVLAGLSHPNIVTTYDVDEQGDSLFVVMELLDGKELKHLLAEKADVALEHKLTAMVQMCNAVQYLLDKSIVDAVVEPSNVALLADGSAKVVDLGIARLANPSAVVAARYPSPEDAGGKGDALAHQFSLASLFYEMVAFVPPWSASDPNTLYQQVRTTEPASLRKLNPDIPEDLAAAIERALIKKRAQRYSDLGALRGDLETVQKRIAKDTEPLRERLGVLVGEADDLEAGVAKRLGFAAPAAAPATLPQHLDAIMKLTRSTEARIEALRAKAAKVESIEFVFRRGSELLEAGNFAEACVEFEAVLSQFPEFAAASAALERARSGAETRRRQEVTAKFIGEARKALAQKYCERCLELLQQAADVPAPAEAEAEIATLRDDAKTLMAELEASRRAKQQAERARETMVEAKTAAAGQDVAKHAPAAWKAADETVKQAEAHFKAEKFAEAFLSFEAAVGGYQKAVDEARDAKERERLAAEAAEAARRLALTNEILEQARAAFKMRAYERCQGILRKAIDIPPPEQSTEAIRKLNEDAENALQTERRAKTPAQTARMLMAETRTDAQAEGAETRAPGAWADAEAKASEGASAFAIDLFVSANEAYELATRAFRAALDEARAAKLREKESADAARQQAVAQERHQLAARFLAEARAAHERGDQELCLDVLDAAARVSSTPEAQEEVASLRRAAETARMQKKAAEQAVQADDLERQKAESARALVIEAVRALHGQSGTSAPAAALWDEVEVTVGQAHAAFARGNHAAAFAAYESALALCQRCADEIRGGEVRDRAAAENAAREQTAAAAAKVAATAAAAAAKASATPPAASPASSEPPAKPAGASGDAARSASTDSAAKKPADAPVDPALARSVEAAFAGSAAASADSDIASRLDAPNVLTPSRAERTAGIKSTRRNGNAAADAAATERRTFTPTILATIVVVAALLAVGLIQFEYRIAKPEAPPGRAVSSVEGASPEGGLGGAVPMGDTAAAALHPAPANDAPAAPAALASAEATAAADARAAEEAKVAADAKAAEARAASDATAAKEAKAAADAQAVADAKAASDAATIEATKADQAKTVADAKAAEMKALDDAKAMAKAEGTAAVKSAAANGDPKPVFVKAYASVFNEPTDGKRVGGAWGACWRTDAASARACAKASCESTRRTSQPCRESASTDPGGHCAVSSASGYGVSAGACTATRSTAEAAATAGCSRQLARTYPGATTACRVAWSTDPH